jgi:aerobic-type carbon monoxide dehydrogenase small subunit (CoxS/CutS family)
VPTLDVNGGSREVAASSDSALLWALRDELGLVAAKYGCGLDQCGACTVLVGGRRVASCQLTVGDAGTQPIETLEALRTTPEGEAVIDALAAANAGQCGYCLPGIAVTLIDLARRGGVTDRRDVASALDAHLCRCGSQPRILRAAVEALGRLASDRATA